MPNRSGDAAGQASLVGQAGPVGRPGGARQPGAEDPTAGIDPTAWIDRAAREYPQHLFLRTPDGVRYTYADLQDATGRFASVLQKLGVTVGDRVAVRVEKSPDAVLLYIACLRLGAAFVPINVAYSAVEVEYFLTDSQPRVVVVDPADAAVLGVGHVLTLGSNGEGTLMEAVRIADSRFEPPSALTPDSLAAIVYTSGTTGRSKGAMLTRGNLASNASVLAQSWRFTGDDVLLHVLPLFHVHGLFAAINTVLASGSSMVLLSKFDARQALNLLPGVTVFMGVPTHYTRLLHESALGPETTRGMRLFVSGSAPLLAETHQEFFHRTGHQVLERYGMTETLMNTSNPYDGARVPGSVGPPLPGISVRVVNPETQAIESAPEAVGALEIRGPNVFAGYWRDEVKTRNEFTADGWFKTGDLGRIDGNGYVFIVGRAKDLVITGGYNVYPKEVESELDAVPGVVESAVFGVAHPDFGEGVTAAVVLERNADLSESDILHSIRSRLAGYKLPKRIVFVAELPRNTMGKVQKNVLRATHAGLYQAPG
jgi:malonyl-CoA/methylmalonyl-CoA synthetase